MSPACTSLFSWHSYERKSAKCLAAGQSDERAESTLKALPRRTSLHDTQVITSTASLAALLSSSIMSKAGAAPLDSKLQQSLRAGFRTEVVSYRVHLFCIVQPRDGVQVDNWARRYDDEVGRSPVG